MTRHTVVFAAAAAMLASFALPARAADELARRASWSQPTYEEVKGRVDAWLADRPLDDKARAAVEVLWPAEGLPAALLDQVAATLAAADPAAREVVEFTRGRASLPARFSILSDDAAAPFARHNLRLVFARWLIQNRLYDEAVEALAGLEPGDVVDPAALLFYRGVAHHRLLEKDACLPELARLLENEPALPRRYAALARLMQADMAPLRTDSLDEVARLMDDIRRRLDLGRAGTKVRQQEDDVIAKLDKMIEELEQQQQQQQQSSSSGGQLQPTSPMQDSNPGGGSGPGKVDPKDIGHKSGWGDLPPKDRQEALQQISKDFPSHYREAIEEYFRKLARDGVAP
jgi:hypothetical protein